MKHYSGSAVRGWVSVFIVFVATLDSCCISYFVSQTGTNAASGSPIHPWKTINYATHHVTAGDTVVVREGIYFEPIQFAHSGLMDRPIVLKAYENETVVLDGTDGSHSLVYISGAFIVLKGLRIQNASGRGILLESADHITIRDCYFQDVAYSAIRTLVSSNIRLVNNTITNAAMEMDWAGGIRSSYDRHVTISGNQISETTAWGILIEESDDVSVEGNKTDNTLHSGIGLLKSDSVTVCNNTIILACNGGYSECLSLSDCVHFQVYQNEIHTSGDVRYGGEGIDLKDGCRHGKLFDNYVHDIDKVALYLDAWENPTFDIQVFGNRIENCSNGMALGSEQNGALNDIAVFKNCVSHSGIGLNIPSWVNNGPRHNIDIYNNTFCHNIGGIVIETTNIDTISIINNLCSQNQYFQLSIPESLVDEVVDGLNIQYNLIDGVQIHDTSRYGSHYVLASPVFIDTASFHLQPGSPAIDAGHPDPIYQDPDGTRNDIGAFFFDQSAIVPAYTKPSVPDGYDLSETFPNPFNATTCIRYTIPVISFVELCVFNIHGQEIEKLLNANQEAGTHSIHFNVACYSSGIYFLKIQTDSGWIDSQKMVVIK